MPIAYGIEKLHIGCVIVDSQVSTEDMIEKILEMEGTYEDIDEDTEEIV
eukprot:CAMPEP_0201283326 /NCGR_PEP_ID=MMETSP1317-20130820/8231_1 /ASSEMBLY_ACC=CAM_ASM_000770 /TAXON_ID=187299 /ORGANISM="Undescribed Undescribed, Strain Undescribed" /LENGTH=48 /DNA_ID= /DNA_START= /DNA_END= /DNA_ORIENTATION=